MLISQTSIEAVKLEMSFSKCFFWQSKPWYAYKRCADIKRVCTRSFVWKETQKAADGRGGYS